MREPRVGDFMLFGDDNNTSTCILCDAVFKGFSDMNARAQVPDHIRNNHNEEDQVG